MTMDRSSGPVLKDRIKERYGNKVPPDKTDISPGGMS